MLLPQAASLLAAVMITAGAPNLLADDVSGRYTISETRAGNRCTGLLSLTAAERGDPVPGAQTVLGAQRGSASYTSPCVDPAVGTWTAQDGDRTGPRLAARLEYGKSSVFYSLALEQAPDGALAGKGEIYAAPRIDPNALRKVGIFEARRLVER